MVLNNLYSGFKLLNSSNSILTTCIVSTACSSLTINDMISAPIWSISYTVFVGSCLSYYINVVTPKELTPYVAGAIIFTTSMCLSNRIFRSIFRYKYKKEESVNYNKKKLINNITHMLQSSQYKNLITYNTHKNLKNIGHTLETDLNPIFFKDIIAENIKCNKLTPEVEKNFNMICTILDNNREIFNNISGLFLHDSEKGHLLIKKTDQDIENVVSIKLV